MDPGPTLTKPIKREQIVTVFLNDLLLLRQEDGP